MPRLQSDRGFILFTAIWLLVLAGAICSVLLAQSLRQAKLAVTDAALLRSEMALEGGVHAAISDILIRGAGSPWGRTPAGGTLTIANMPVSLQTSAEAGRLDLNYVELKTIDSAMRGFGASADDRDHVLSAVQQMRQSGHQFRSWNEVQALFSVIADPNTRACLTENSTLYSGLAEPDASQMSAGLARTLGQTGGDGFAGQMMNGAAIMFSATAQDSRLIAVVRPTGLGSRPFEVMRWDLSFASANHCS